MKLENLFNKQKTAPTDSLSRATRKIIEKLAKKDPKAASSLSGIELFTKSEEAALQSAKAISRYDVDAARYIASGLKDIAKKTEDKDAVIGAAKAISRYDGNAARDIALGLSRVALNTENKNKIINAARMMSLDEIRNAV